MFSAQRLIRPAGNIKKWSSLSTVKHIWTSGSYNQQQQTSETSLQKIYELRIYTIQPHRLREFLELTKEEFHLRTAHSKLFGYWMSEIGGLNQVVHIWEYDSLTHRANVRANLALDSVWISRYLGRVVEMFQEMNNSALILLPGTKIDMPTRKGVYELQTLRLNGSPLAWSKTLVEYVKACKEIELNSTKLVGAWQSVLGPKQLAALLWYHPGPDSCISLQQAIESLHENVALSTHVNEGHSRLLLPHPVSPLQ